MISPDSIELVEHYLSGTLTSDEADRLYADLQQSDDLQRYFERQSHAEYMLRTASALDDLEVIDPVDFNSTVENEVEMRFFDDLVRLEKESLPLPNSEKSSSIDVAKEIQKSEKPPTAYRPISKKQFIGAGSILTLVVLIALVAGYSELYPKKTTTFQESFHAVARIVQSVEAEWEDASETYKTGQEIEPGHLKLKSGVVKLVFADGAEMVLEGPTDLLVKGKGNAFCSQGYISVFVPPRAVGFEVATPFGTVIDLGTQFSVQAAETNAEIHVLKGKVDFKPTDKDRFSLTENSAALLELGRDVQNKPANPDSFFSETRLLQLLSNYGLKRKAVWQEQEQRLEGDPNLVFQLKPKQTGLATEHGSRSDKTAIRFRNKRDRYRFQVGRVESRSLTLLACVRLENLQNISNTLLIGDSHYEIPGAFLWQLNRSGILQFHVNDGQSFQRYDSPPVFQRKDCKTWVVLGLVADAENRSITHYFDGRAVATIPWDPQRTLRLDRMALGNEHAPSKRDVVRFFNGDIEEFLIFDRPFSPGEIETFYRNHQ